MNRVPQVAIRGVVLLVASLVFILGIVGLEVIGVHKAASIRSNVGLRSSVHSEHKDPCRLYGHLYHQEVQAWRAGRAVEAPLVHEGFVIPSRGGVRPCHVCGVQLRASCRLPAFHVSLASGRHSRRHRRPPRVMQHACDGGSYREHRQAGCQYLGVCEFTALNAADEAHLLCLHGLQTAPAANYATPARAASTGCGRPISFSPTTRY
jgi:hypothetical protein